MTDLSGIAVVSLGLLFATNIFSCFALLVFYYKIPTFFRWFQKRTIETNEKAKQIVEQWLGVLSNINNFKLYSIKQGIRAFQLQTVGQQTGKLFMSRVILNAPRKTVFEKLCNSMLTFYWDPSLPTVNRSNQFFNEEPAWLLFETKCEIGCFLIDSLNDNSTLLTHIVKPKTSDIKHLLKQMCNRCVGFQDFIHYQDLWVSFARTQNQQLHLSKIADNRSDLFSTTSSSFSSSSLSSSSSSSSSSLSSLSSSSSSSASSVLSQVPSSLPSIASTSVPVTTSSKLSHSVPVLNRKTLLTNKKTSVKPVPVQPTKKEYQPTHRYAEVATQSMQILMNAAKETQAEGWVPVTEKNGVKISKKEAKGSAIQSVRGQGRIDAEPRCVLGFLLTFERKKEWDNLFADGRIIEEFDKYCLVGYMDYHGVWPTTARDFCCLQYVRVWPDGTCTLAGKSVTHEQCPERPDRVRAEIIGGGWVIKPVPGQPSASDVTYISQVDLKGSVPSIVINKVSVTIPLAVANIQNIVRSTPDIFKYRCQLDLEPENQVVEEIPEEQNDEDQTSVVEDSEMDQFEILPDEQEPCLQTNSTEESPSSRQSFESLQLSEEQPASTLSQMGNLSQNSFNKKSVNYIIIANMAAADLLRLADETIDVEPSRHSFPTLVPQSWAAKGWKFVCFKKGAYVVRKPIPSKPSFLCLMTKIDIPRVSASDVFNFIRRVENRKKFDKTVKTAAVIETIDEDTVVVHYVHETVQCFLKVARDFCVVQRCRVEESQGRTRYLLVSQSVEHELCPGPKDRAVLRGHLYSSGVIVEQSVASSERDECTLVTCFAQVDLRGNLNVAAVNSFAETYPLTMAVLKAVILSKHSKPNP